MKKIFLVGNPNVGKSVLFSRLTGVDVIISNYPGTTVEFTKGFLNINNNKYEIYDLPGTYSLKPNSKAEEVTVEIIDKLQKDVSDLIVINIIDATNLERNLNLTLQLINKKLPLIIVLNFWDEIKHLGIEINYRKLEEILNVPVIPICARSGEGINDLIGRLSQSRISNFKFEIEQKWEKIGEIVNKVQKISHRHHTFLDRLSEITIRPLTGFPLSFLILIFTLLFTRLSAEFFINNILDPFFYNFYLPFIKNIILNNIKNKLIVDILLGIIPLPMESFGLLTTGFYIPIVVVAPYIISFYLFLSILEDIGYISRLAIMFDRLLHIVGVHGYSLIPIILGFGCKVPGIFATRILETKKEKIITTLLVLMISPCMPQTAMIISILSPYGIKYVLFTFSIIILNSIFVSYLLRKILRGETSELFLEIPPYRMIHINTLIKKLYLRLKNFFIDAVPLIFLGITIINIFDLLGLNNLIVSNLGKFLMPILGLPKEISSLIILGFLRKDISIALLKSFKLNVKQIIIASLFMTLYLPCISTFFVISKEFNFKEALGISILMFIIGVLLVFIIKNIIVFFI